MSGHAPPRGWLACRCAIVLLIGWQALLLSGCAVVTASTISPARYLSERRGDILTTGRLSDAGQEALRIVGIEDCKDAPPACRDRLRDAPGLTQEQRLSALSELWLEAGLAADSPSAMAAPPGTSDVALDAWLEAARHAWAYLFFTERQPAQRTFEERQTQVRDYYNYAVQRAVEHLFKDHARDAPQAAQVDWAIGGWQLKLRSESLARAKRLPQDLIAASSLRFDGLRNTYRRGGFGATLVAELGPPPPEEAELPFAESRYPVGTAVLRFEGGNLAQILATRSAELVLYDPYRTAQVTLAGQAVPLAANFTAGYGLWLARSGFATQALRNLFGWREGISRPRIQLMQPYDPERRLVIMLHGLASSPEAWVNVANELMGDDVLRQNYQIWQVYYPTNAPLLLNLYTIREAIVQTLAHYDPGGTAPASRDVVLVGHSMGGVLARLLVTDSGDRLWESLPSHLGDQRESDENLRRKLGKYLEFTALPQVERAVFIAAPHRGTPFATGRLAGLVSSLIALPRAMQAQMADVRDAMKQDPAFPQDEQLPQSINSIGSLSDRNPIVRALGELPIDPHVRYHSIIAREDAAGPLANATDGVVPYASAHLDGAASELVIDSYHSVQENPQAILELRRILHQDLAQRPQP